MRVDVDQIPRERRPDDVTALLDEASGLRDKLRHAVEQTAAAQTRLEQAEREDAEAAAERVRKGSPLGAEQPAVEKARRNLEQTRRAERALELAVGAALVELASTLDASSPAWLDELEQAAGEARERGRAALVELEHALADLSTASSAAAWVRSGASDGRWDRRPPTTTAGAASASSRHITANGTPIGRDMLLGYCLELVAEPTPPPVTILEPEPIVDSA
jgi:hypothetical protein